MPWPTDFTSPGLPNAKAADACGDSGFRFGVAESFQPAGEDLRFADFDHEGIVA